MRAVAFVAALGVVSGAWLAATQFAVDLRPQLLEDLWYSWGAIAIVHALAALVGFAVGRWWALLAAAGPLVAGVVLHVSDHVAPWHEPMPPLRLGVFGAFALACAIALGVGVRRGLRGGPRYVNVRM